MARARRLLLLTTSMARGGAEQQVVDLAVELRARGWTVAVLSMTAPTDHMDELAAAEIELATLGMARGRPTPAALLRYVSFVRRWRPDVVHSHMVHANLLGRIGRLLAPRVPVVCTVHNVLEGRRWREVAYRLTDPLASATTAVSAVATARYVRVGAAPRGRIVTIPNGFNFSRDVAPDGAREAVRQELDVDGFLWVTVGRLVPAKGHDLLLEAFRAVHEVRIDARLAIAGDGPERRALSDLRRKLELEESVALLGRRRDVPSILAAADAFVLASRWEGLPMVLLEAAARRLPIVSTDVGGCRDVARPALGAVLTRAKPDAISSAMLRVMGMTAAERTTIGAALRDHVEREFDIDVIVSRWERLYASVIMR
jgi:glycosyltransferase involved in cell wall biosynthesis